MGQKEKLIQRLKAKPKDFTFDEAEALLVYCLNDIYNNSIFCQRLLIGRKNNWI